MTEVTQIDQSETTPRLQPLLHDLASCVAAPGLLLAAADGQVRQGGVSGWYAGDFRLLDTLELAVEGSGLDLVRSATVGADRQEFSYVARSLGDRLPDPTVRIDRCRALASDALAETIVVESVAQDPVDVVLHVSVGTDLQPMGVVKRGDVGARRTAQQTPIGLRWQDHDLEIAGEPAPEVDATAGRLTWRFPLARGERREISLRATDRRHR